MSSERMKPETAHSNGQLWGGKANDWANIQEGQCRSVYQAVFERLELAPGMSYFDAGCGSGMAAQIAVQQDLKVSGLDAASNLLEIAKTRVPNGDFQLGELERLSYQSNHFDLVTGFNSFQYAGNPNIALAEAKRVAKDGGQVIIMTWGKPEGMEAAALISAIKHLLPAPPPGTPGPFALSEESALRSFCEDAGLIPVELFDVQSDWEYPDKHTALRGLCSAGVAIKAIEFSSEAAVKEAYSNALDPFLKPDGSYRIKANFRCLLAHA